MNRILEIDEKNMIAVVEPGVINSHLQEKLEEKKLFYPPDPASMKFCTLGGNVAENAGGPRAIKYGVTGIPTFVFSKINETEFHTKYGFLPKKDLETFICGVHTNIPVISINF